MQGAMSKNKPICETGSSQASVFVDSVTVSKRNRLERNRTRPTGL